MGFMYAMANCYLDDALMEGAEMITSEDDEKIATIERHINRMVKENRGEALMAWNQLVEHGRSYRREQEREVSEALERQERIKARELQQKPVTRSNRVKN